MANRRRGEIAATIAGRPYTLCLTLGALAELECAFAVGDLTALGSRFGSGRLSAEDLVKLVGAGLRGGGHPITDEEIRAWPGACLPETAAAVAELLAATFGEDAANPAGPQAI
jgi:hypothetical protein